ncbi:MAG: DNA phosphorothioation system sulfurtransferase DndC [Verrucomicrobia bacterium]|nr:MAG: DNA phosphorothioation system sulfurtransferase DndC [Verrucomicrobiota bacterium]
MPSQNSKKSAFSELGLKGTIEQLKREVRELYVSDDVPWIIGYSGGKDSTAVLQLAWLAIAELPPEKRRKKVYVISTDTLVENPVVAAWVTGSLEVMRAAATTQKMPFEPHRLTPRTEDSFWVNLIGKGYPTPRHKFRWCTERLKIKPSTSFITGIVKQSGEAILLLGSRGAESDRRKAVLAKHAERARTKGHYGTRERLSPNASLPNTLVYTPIENWFNDDVWMFLMQMRNPWGYNNKDLLSMYQGASPDGECPLVVDSSTPSCGDSRFGCWVCTLVDKDKSMTAMIQNDEEKEWMMPLLELRNALDFRTGSGDEQNSDRHLRDFRRMSGAIQLFHDRPIPGPYTQEARENWLRKLLSAQTWIRRNGPTDVRNIELVSLPELEEIRRLWVVEKHEMEDSLPRIYAEATGEPYPGQRLDDSLVLGEGEMHLLREICGGDRLHYELTRELLSVERQQRAHARRAGLFELLDKSIGRHYYEGREDATEMARRHAQAREAAGRGERTVGFNKLTARDAT